MLKSDYTGGIMKLLDQHVWMWKYRLKSHSTDDIGKWKSIGVSGHQNKNWC